MYFSASLMYKSQRTDSEPPLWEERIILVSAIDEAEAEEKAKKNATEYESIFIASNSVEIKWNFYKVERVYSIDGSLDDGVELFSRFLRSAEAESILTPFDD